jgi:glutaredoxin
MSKVVIFTRPDCGPCKTLIYWLGKQGIKYTLKDIDENRDEVLYYSNASIVPITVIDDDPAKVIEGLNLQRVKDLLG